MARSLPRETSENRPQPPGAGFTNTPEDILSAWTALEILTPSPLPRDTGLTGGGRDEVVRLDGQGLPWEEGVESQEGYRPYYQLVLGTVELREAAEQLSAKYGDTRIELPRVRGQSIVANVILDQNGLPARQPAGVVSSFAWGVGVALRAGLRELGEWPGQEAILAEELGQRISRTDADGTPLPLSAETIDDSHHWLMKRLGLNAELVNPSLFCVVNWRHVRNPDPPEPLLMSSFFLEDLARARNLFRRGSAPPNLMTYLGVDPPAFRQDLLEHDEAILNAAAPSLFPLGRWPGPGRHPLVLLQQAAVNLAMSLSGSPGVLAVNGPPGTGKTTLLRDVIAANVVARAEQMARRDDPATAFSATKERINTGGSSWLQLYRLAPELRGYEMLVASSNNKAVENVSAELPVLDSIAEDAQDLRYFRTVSDKLLGRETWGLIAAVLGNARNRRVFMETFWWDQDFGMYSYLAHASGRPRPIKYKDTETGETGERHPRIVVEEDAPQDHREAVERWLDERKRFVAALEASQLARAQLAVLSDYLLNGDGLRGDTKNRQQDLEAHQAMRPGWISRLFRPSRYRAWRNRFSVLDNDLARARIAEEQAENQFATAATAFLQKEKNGSTTGPHPPDGVSPTELVEMIKDAMGDRLVDSSFLKRPHQDKQLVAPWFDEQTHRVRDDVFVAAIRLHKAFVAAAARPLRHNMNVLMNVLGGDELKDSNKTALLGDLWSSLFLVTPVISTTLASVGRMFKGLPVESLGWLLIDEAGQATPQAAVGALMRTRRAVVVGDPLQVEPVVTLSDRLTQDICRSFGVDPDTFNAPEASVQTLADAATPYMAEFDGIQGSRTVGVPLLVHRRCADPMFSVSNEIAYENLMVQAVPARPSAIRDALGPSRWIHVQGSMREKWCPEEGQAVLWLLNELTSLDGAPDLYVVTPFVVVQNNLRRLVRQDGVLERWGVSNENWVNERIGTVHTVQGREAEAVIFVLGAPDAVQAGARKWAGSRPNLLNVAATRAKEVIYVIGNRDLWRDAGVFGMLDKRIRGVSVSD